MHIQNKTSDQALQSSQGQVSSLDDRNSTPKISYIEHIAITTTTQMPVMARYIMQTVQSVVCGSAYASTNAAKPIERRINRLRKQESIH